MGCSLSSDSVNQNIKLIIFLVKSNVNYPMTGDIILLFKSYTGYCVGVYSAPVAE